MTPDRLPLDPVLSPREMALDAGISLKTRHRNYRHTLRILYLSPKRIGVRQSEWRKALEQRKPSSAA
jgi:hypothetical protein